MSSLFVLCSLWWSTLSDTSEPTGESALVLLEFLIELNYNNVVVCIYNYSYEETNLTARCMFDDLMRDMMLALQVRTVVN